MCVADPPVPEPIALEVEMALGKSKRYGSPGIDEYPVGHSSRQEVEQYIRKYIIGLCSLA